MPVAGADTVAKNIKSFGGGFLKHVNKVMTHVKENLDSEVTQNMSLTDHTLPALRKMGHPYAAKHGSRGMPIHDPYWAVHTHGGKLLSSKRSGIIEASVEASQLKAAAYVGLNNSIADYAKYIIWGTTKMIPRDVLSNTLNDRRFQTVTREYIKDNLRDLVVNFKGIETK